MMPLRFYQQWEFFSYGFLVLVEIYIQIIKLLPWVMAQV